MSLHWLPVKYRAEFKNVLFVYKALNNLANRYLELIRIHCKKPEIL